MRTVYPEVAISNPFRPLNRLQRNIMDIVGSGGPLQAWRQASLAAP
jgi:hypothetical protein